MKKSLISIVELKELLKDEEITKDEYRNEIVNMFIKSLKFNYSEIIGQGSFSTVLRVWNKKAVKGFAIKIVLKEDLGPREKEWAKLHHKNILILLDTEDFPVFDLTWFLSPVVEVTLEEVLKGKILQNETMAFKLAVSWTKEITSALDYLHTKELGFFNLKVSNVMICEDQSIKLFGFHRLNNIGRFTNQHDVPTEYQPPESYSADCRRLPIEGKAFDLWCLGILSIEVFTGSYFSRNVPDKVCCWNDDIYPKLFRLLKKKNFNTEFQSVFRNCNQENKMIKVVRNFIRACLRFSPESRPSAKILLHHKLFEDRGLLSTKDKIWKKQLKPKSIKLKIGTMNFLFETTRPFLSTANQINVHDISVSYIDADDGTADDKVKNIVENTVANDGSMHEVNTYDTENGDITDIMITGTQENAASTEISMHIINAYSTNNTYNHLNKIISNIHLLNEMFGRILMVHYQDNLKCRLLHRESVMRALRNYLEIERKFMSEKEYPDAIRDSKSKPTLSRMKNIGTKIASNIFQFFI